MQTKKHFLNIITFGLLLISVGCVKETIEPVPTTFDYDNYKTIHFKEFSDGTQIFEMRTQSESERYLVLKEEGEIYVINKPFNQTAETRGLFLQVGNGNYLAATYSPNRYFLINKELSGKEEPVTYVQDLYESEYAGYDKNRKCHAFYKKEGNFLSFIYYQSGYIEKVISNVPSNYFSDPIIVDPTGDGYWVGGSKLRHFTDAGKDIIYAPSSNINQILFDKHNHLWASYGNAIIHYDMQFVREHNPLNTPIPSLQTERFDIDTSGVIYARSYNGHYAYHPRKHKVLMHGNNQLIFYVDPYVNNNYLKSQSILYKLEGTVLNPYLP